MYTIIKYMYTYLYAYHENFCYFFFNVYVRIIQKNTLPFKYEFL